MSSTLSFFYWFLTDLLNPSTLFWLALGLFLCATELFLPRLISKSLRWVGVSLGLPALAIGLGGSTIQLYAGFPIQIVLWMGFALAFVTWGRPLLQQRSRQEEPVRTATTAKVLIDIDSGELGRVLYEGTSWQARCEDSTQRIGAGEKVHVVRQEGTTLVVVPEGWLC